MPRWGKPPERQNTFVQSPLIKVRRVANRGRGGRGVFATEDIAKGQIIETVPMIVMPREQVFPKGCDKDTKALSRISWYVFEWFPEKGVPQTGLALGYGSLYNHSYSANAEYIHAGKDFMHFRAVKNIKKGEEIFVNYNGRHNDKKKYDFGEE